MFADARQVLMQEAGYYPPLEEVKPLEQARKDDSGKVRFELLDPDALYDMAQVLTFGATKYSANNWQGLRTGRIVGSLLRHTFAWLRGQDTDDETGLSHMAHVLCCAMFLHWLARNKPELDDRRQPR